MPAKNNGIVCRECGGSGCEACNHSGYSRAYYLEHPYDEAEGYTTGKHEDDTVPMPYGKMLPDLTDCYYPNDPWPSYLDPILCPNCGSDHVVGLDKKYNPECSVMGENLTPSGRWFCISCHDSWCYEYEH